jgi:hypothetical protein
LHVLLREERDPPDRAPQLPFNFVAGSGRLPAPRLERDVGRARRGFNLRQAAGTSRNLSMIALRLLLHSL